MKKPNNISVLLIVMMTLGITPMLASCSDKTAKATSIVNETGESSARVEETKAINDTTAETETEVEADDWEAPQTEYYTPMKTMLNDGNDNAYLTFYGDPVISMTYDELVGHVDDYIVGSDKYIDTDLYDLASELDGAGYTLTDIPSKYSIYGGYFFKEGFRAQDWGEILDMTESEADKKLLKAHGDADVEVIKTDAATLEDYLQHYFVIDSDYVVESFDKEEEDGKITYTMLIKRIILQKEVEFNIIATFDKGTEIAIIEKVDQ